MLEYIVRQAFLLYNRFYNNNFEVEKCMIGFIQFGEQVKTY